MTVRFLDLSHELEHGMITYKGLPAPCFSDLISREDSRSHYEPGTEFHLGKIEMPANSGTYIDSPYHRYPEGKDIADLPLASMANLPGVVVRAQSRVCGPELFENIDPRGKAVLIHTGWARYWRTERYFDGNPYLTEEAAVFLRDHGVTLVGIDSLNIDDTSGSARPVHSILLEAEIPIVEHLCGLERLPDHGYTFFAVPVKARKMSSFPVRAFALVDEGEQAPAS